MGRKGKPEVDKETYLRQLFTFELGEYEATLQEKDEDFELSKDDRAGIVQNLVALWGPPLEEMVEAAVIAEMAAQGLDGTGEEEDDGDGDPESEEGDPEDED